MLRKTLLLGLGIGLGTAALAIAQPAPAGRAFRVATAAEITVGWADLAVASDGRFVAVWGASTNSLANFESLVMARVFDAEGRPLTGELRVASGRDISTYSPFVALLETDVFLVGWLENRTLRARRYGFDGRPRGRSFELARPEDPASSPFFLTQTCADAQGRFLLYWREGARLRARRFDHRARPLGERIEVATVSPSGSAGMALGCNAAGGFALTWAGDPAASGGLWVRRWDGEGRPLGTALEVTTGESAYGAIVALAEDGHFAVAWGSGPRKHRARFFRSDGRPLGRAKTVLTLDVTLNRLGSYDLLALADGDFLQLWHDLALRVGGIPDAVVFAQRFAPDGRRRGDRLELRLASGPAAWDLVVRRDALDGLVALWSGGFGPGALNQLVGRRFDAEEPGRPGLWAPRLVLAEGEGGAELFVQRTGGAGGALAARLKTRAGTARAGRDFEPIDTQVVFGHAESQPQPVALELIDDALAEPTETLRVVLRGARGGEGFGELVETVVEIRDDDGQPPLDFLGPPQQIGVLPVWQNQPSHRAFDALLLSDGTLEVARESEGGIECRRFDRLGALLETVRTEPEPDPYLVRRFNSPRLVANPHGDLAAVWIERRPSGHVGTFDRTFVWARRAGDASWWPHGEAIASAGDGRSGQPGGAAWSADGRLVVAGVEDHLGWRNQRVLIASFDGAGRLASTAEVLVPLSVNDTQIRVATLAGGSTLAVRQSDYDGDGSGVTAVRLPVGGFATGAAEEAVEIVDGLQDQPDLAAASPERVLAVWRSVDPITGRSAVAGRWLGADASPIGPELAISVSTLGTISQPRIAAAGGRFVVVWEHVPAGTESAELRAQLLDQAGRAVGPELRIPSATGAPQHRPVVSANAAGDLAVAWEEESDEQTNLLFVQRLQPASAGARTRNDSNLAFRPATRSDQGSFPG